MEMMDNAINWFEIPVSNFDRAQQFYSAIYDFEMPASDMGDVRMGFFLYDFEKGEVGGAICAGPHYEPAGSKGPWVYLNGGKDLNTVLNRVEAAGGKVLVPKTQISPEHGFYANFEDTEGNVIALHSRG